MLDGFTMQFYKNYKLLTKNVNNSYIEIIGKKGKCFNTTPYKPINLTNFPYKIIAKTIVARLKSTLPSTIFKNQLAFVKDRKITDAILMANEAVEFWRT